MEDVANARAFFSSWYPSVRWKGFRAVIYVLHHPASFCAWNQTQLATIQGLCTIRKTAPVRFANRQPLCTESEALPSAGSSSGSSSSELIYSQPACKYPNTLAPAYLPLFGRLAAPTAGRIMTGRHFGRHDLCWSVAQHEQPKGQGRRAGIAASAPPARPPRH